MALYPAYPPELSTVQRDYVVTCLKEWALCNGLAVRPPTSFVKGGLDPHGDTATAAPVTLFPSLFPKKCFQEALSIQQAYNELYAKIASDEGWLEDVVKELADIDDFIANLWKVHIAVRKEGYAHEYSLGIFRSDYMVHVDKSASDERQPCLRQVEFNTIASSFGGLVSRVSSLHKYLTRISAYPDSAYGSIHQEILPEDPSVERISTGIAYAHAAYGQAKVKANGKPLPLCGLVIIQDVERNVFDQKIIELEVQSRWEVTFFRLPFSRVMNDTRVDSETRALLYTPPAFPDRCYEVTTVYYRAGYTPTDYPDQSAWDARLQLERSAAIKCPTVLTHLAGCKKVQQILATPDSPHVARFLQDEEMAARVKATFAPMYPLDASAAGQEGKSLATDPRTAVNYVVKPQREGGGNNIYRKAIPEFLKGIPEQQWAAYILMEMIETPVQRNSILRGGEVMTGGVICELGVYGACIWRKGVAAEMAHNEGAGYLLRTKGDSSEEGGVAAGFGAVDSCCLVDV